MDNFAIYGLQLDNPEEWAVGPGDHFQGWLRRHSRTFYWFTTYTQAEEGKATSRYPHIGDHIRIRPIPDYILCLIPEAADAATRRLELATANLMYEAARLTCEAEEGRVQALLSPSALARRHRQRGGR